MKHLFLSRLVLVVLLGFGVFSEAVCVVRAALTQPAQPTVRVSVVLPFGAKGVEGSRSVEFYRGFLMAVDVVKQRGINVCVNAYDEGTPRTDIAPILERVSATHPDLLIAPVYPSHFESVSAFATRATLPTAVPFSSRISQITSNPFLVALNAPETFRSQAAVELVAKNFGKSGQIIVVQTAEASERDFTDALSAEMRQRGYAVATLPQSFTTAELQQVVRAGVPNLIIPDASEVEVMRALAERVRLYRTAHSADDIALLGYPEWVGEAARNAAVLHEANTYILTPSFYNTYDVCTRNLEADYKIAFGSVPTDMTPRLFLLGYDFGLYALVGIAEGGATFWGSKTPAVAQLQTDFRFARPSAGCGFVNTCMWMLHYKTDRSIDKISRI